MVVWVEAAKQVGLQPSPWPAGFGNFCLVDKNEYPVGPDMMPFTGGDAATFFKKNEHLQNIAVNHSSSQ